MSYFLVERDIKGNIAFEIITGVEDIDLSQYNDVKTLWVCDTLAECDLITNEMKEMRDARSSQPS